ncbi:MAG TPA: tetratricopeptide repeat protein [Acidobacteriaceae bacterium]|jgi:tetratricopeptide (TPR) repeat protein
MTRAVLCPVLILCCFPWLTGWAQSSRDDEVARDVAAGQRAMAQGDYAAAQPYFEKLAQLEPRIAEVHATLAAIDFKRREYEKAVAEIHTALRLKPGLPKLDSLLGLSLAEEGKVAEALPQLEKGFHQIADPEVRRMCGLELLRAYSDLNRDSDAVETSLALNKAFPDDPEVLYHTGRVYGNQAYVVLEKLHDTAPDSIWMLQAQGEANESQKNWEAAIVAFNHVLTIDPNRPGIHYRLGRVYLGRFRDAGNAQDRDAAISQFTAELTVDAGNGNAAYELAYLQAEAGNRDEAAKDYEQLLHQYPAFEEALVGLAGIDIASQKADQAVPLLERATRLRPDDEVAWWRLAQADRATGNADGQRTALATFQKIHTIIAGTLAKPNANEVTPQRLDTNAQP